VWPDVQMMTYQDRTYRSFVKDDRLESFRVVVKETDLLVRAETLLENETRDLVLKHRLPLERYAEDYPGFLQTLTPFPEDLLAPSVVRTMIWAAQKAGVGPMAAVAGAIAEYVGKDLLAYSREVMVENGGDIFINTNFPITLAVFAGTSPLSNKLGLRVDSPGSAMGVCTSSGTVGHSLSFGSADAIVVISESAALADAAATAVGNSVSKKTDIATAVNVGKNIQGVLGLVIIVGAELGVWGSVELVKL